MPAAASCATWLRASPRLRDLRLSPVHARLLEQRAVFIEVAGWERPAWFEAKATLPEIGQVPAREGWSGRHWSVIQGAEHLRTRESAGLFDLSALTRTEVTGPGALAFMQRLCVSDMAIQPGTITWTLLCDTDGGIRTDATVLRLADTVFELFTTAGAAPRDEAWIRSAMPAGDAGGSVRDVSSGRAGLGLWGPAAQAILEGATGQALDQADFPAHSVRSIEVGPIPALAARTSQIGEDDWEVWTRNEYAASLWDRLWRAGGPYGLIAGGTGAIDSLRIARGIRRMGSTCTATPIRSPSALEGSLASTSRSSSAKPRCNDGPPNPDPRPLSGWSLRPGRQP